MNRRLVDPELLAALDIFPSFTLSAETIDSLRDGMRMLAPSAESVARPDIETSRRQVAGPAGAPDVAVLIHRPTTVAGPLPAYLHIHGGGYVFGDAAGSSPSNIRTAAELGCLVVSVDYRLAPETRAPGAVEDCYAVLAWLHREASTLGIDPARIAIGGESAGGGLAAALALMARDRGDFTICFQLLIYPMLDDRTVVSPGENPHVGDFVWTRDANAFGWEALLGHPPGQASISPYAAAARAEDLTGLPPAYISVGALDLFLEENITYATRLLRAGVATELHVFPGAYHGFELAADASVSKTAEHERRAALGGAFSR